MTDQTTQPVGPAKTDAKPAKSAAPTRKQKFSEAELKRLGLDPACYGFVKK